jgi:hypothetical protein
LGVVLLLTRAVFILAFLFIVKEAIILFLLHLELFPDVDFFLDFFLTSLFLVECFTQIGELYGNHQVKHKEGAKQYATDEESIIEICPFGFSNDIHHGGPTFKSDNLENVEDRHEDIVKVKGILNRVLPLFAIGLR